MQSDPTPSSGECLLLENPQRELRESARPLVSRLAFLSTHASGFLGIGFTGVHGSHPMRLGQRGSTGNGLRRTCWFFTVTK
jgi:hypothetical protein